MRRIKTNWLFFKLLGLFLLFFCIWWFRLERGLQKNLKIGEKVKIRGVLRSYPYFTVSNQILKIGQFKVLLPLFPGYSYGDDLEIFGKIDRIVLRNLEKEFGLFYPEIRVVEDGERTDGFGLGVKKHLFTIRLELEKTIKKIMPEPESSLFAGILLGIKRGLPADFFERLRLTGTLHVVVASGMNVTIVAKILIDFLAGLVSRKKALFVSFLGILVYTILVGAEPPIIRAAIMGGLSFLAMYLGREADGLMALFVAGGAMLLWQPRLLFDLGFQLSFMATAGIVLLSERFKRMYKRLPKDIGSALSETTAAQVMVVPILVANFGRLSVVSLLVNGILLWMIPSLMYFGLGLLVVGTISITLGRIFGLFFWPILHFFVVVVEAFSKLPWAEVKIEWFGFEAGLVYYGILFVILLKFKSGGDGSCPALSPKKTHKGSLLGGPPARVTRRLDSRFK